jgi:hypothetical protein
VIDLEKVADVIRDTGYVAVGQAGGIPFKVEGISHLFETFENDDTYARLRVDFLIPPGVGMKTLLNAANEQNRKTKAVKTVVYPLPADGHVAFSVELFFADSAAWRPIFERALRTLRIASDEYFASLAEVKPARRGSRRPTT